jgi:adenine phosphoribosyltransferase
MTDTKDIEFIKSKIRTIPGWPKPGIMFRDVTTLMKDVEGFNKVIELFYDRYKDNGIQAVVGIESRGFITGAVLASKLGVGFIPIRKKGKLPGKVISEEYELEYGTDTIEIHDDALEKGEKVLLVDDLIATGGTALAACKLLEKLGAEVVECNFIIDLPDLGGTKKLEDAGFKSFSLVAFEGD